MTNIVSISSPTMLLYGAASLLLLIVGRWIFRLTLHPLAKFPGPKLAAMTSAYAMSWELPVPTSYIKNFPAWHDKYGPIIRIEPNHLHIRDVGAYNEVFKIGTKFNRDPALYSFPFTRGSFFNKIFVKEAKPHRDMYGPYFSRAGVMNLEGLIKEHVGSFLKQIDKYSTAKKSIDLTRGYRCLTADTIMTYSYNKPYGAIQSPDFEFPMLENFEAFFDNTTTMWYLPKLMNLIIDFVNKLPRSWIQSNKPFAAALGNLDGCTARIKEMQREPPSENTTSVFKTALNPKVEKGQPMLTANDLGADALVIYTAGTDTTANTLVTGTWGLLNNKPQMLKLRKELQDALPYHEDLSIMETGWAGLEKLETLQNVVKESLRLAYGVPGKIPRIVPEGGATLCGQFVPAGTAVSMACYTYHHNPAFFPDEPNSFKPERWEDKEASDKMDKAFIPFSRGSRSCIGSNLAYAQLYYAFAYLFRNFELEVFETTQHEMDWHDAFVVATFGHLKVKARRLRD